MSRRNSRDQKAIRRLRRALQVTPPGSIDLVAWLVDNGHAKSKRAARELILAKKVKADSHPLGIDRGYDKLLDREVEYVNPLVPAELRGRIIVSN